MTDIVERLRNAETSVRLSDGSVDLVCHVAADEIERLRKSNQYLTDCWSEATETNARLREALREIEKMANRRSGHAFDGDADYLRVARTALKEDK